MITCYFGNLGQGKTYALVKQCFEELKAGRVVYTNFELKWNGQTPNRLPWFLSRPYIPKSNLRRFHSVEQLLQIDNAFIALDEGWLLLDSYLGTKLALPIRSKLFQSRKMGIDIAYTTQRISQVHKTLRNLTNEFYECVAVDTFRRKFFQVFLCDVDNAGNHKRAMHTVWERVEKADGTKEWQYVDKYIRPRIDILRKSIAESYNTLELVHADGKVLYENDDVEMFEKVVVRGNVVELGKRIYEVDDDALMLAPRVFYKKGIVRHLPEYCFDGVKR